VAEQSVRRIGRPPSTVDGQTVPQRLLNVARTLFAEKGFEGTSVQDVVVAAGVTKGAMYHYFSSKDDLLYEIYGRVLRMQMERLEKFVSQEGPVEERLHAAAADVVATTIENLDSTTIFFRSLHQLSEEKQKEIRRERRRYHETFRAMVVEGQQSGVFREDVSADLCVDFFFGSVHHLPTWWNPRGRLSGQEVGRLFADLFIAGLIRKT
jgi:AcrR family transcriptional regulator